MNYEKLTEEANREIADAIKKAWSVGLRENEIVSIIYDVLAQLRRTASNPQFVPFFTYSPKRSDEAFIAYNMNTDEWFQVAESKLAEIKREMNTESGWVFLPLYAFNYDVNECIKQLQHEATTIREAVKGFNSLNE